VGEERKFATVLFADIVGSTAFGEAHDPEIVREALARTFSGWRQIITSHGGTVEKFIGDAVMAVFGVPLAHEDDPERAVRAAFAVRERVRSGEAADGDGHSFDIRIGIASGEVVSGGGENGSDFLVTGASVNLATRSRASSRATPSRSSAAVPWRRRAWAGSRRAPPRRSSPLSHRHIPRSGSCARHSSGGSASARSWT